ncbi:MAG: YncE family protein [Halodesulfurarchaeum sp.]
MGELVVLNKDADSVWFIDADTGEHRGTVDTDFNPHEVAVTPDGTTSFVTCSLGGSLCVIDNETREIRARFEHDAFDFPHGLAVRESAGELWLVATYSSQVFVFDLESVELRDTFSTHQDKSHMIAFSPDESRAYIANIGSGSVTVIDAESRNIVADPVVGEEPEGIAVDPATGEVLVASQEEARLYRLDPDTLETDVVSLLGETPIRVVFEPAGRFAFVANRESHDVSVVDTDFQRDGERTPWEVERIPVGRWPGGTVFDGDGTRAFVANNKTNDVSVLDVSTRAEVGRFSTDLHPDGIAYIDS